MRAAVGPLAVLTVLAAIGCGGGDEDGDGGRSALPLGAPVPVGETIKACR